MTSGFNHTNSIDKIEKNRKPAIVDVGNSTVLCQYVEDEYVPIGGSITKDKFIPGVCLPVVELTTPITAETELTQEESAKISEAVKAGTPIVLTFTDSSFGGNISALFSISKLGEIIQVICYLYTVFYALATRDGISWTMYATYME